MSDNHSQRTEALTPGRAVGIDLGTTNSVVAYVNAHGQPEVIPSAEGGRTVPSVFAITAEGDHLVGTPAVDQEATNPEGTVRSIKRSMGTNTCAMLKPEGSKHAYVLHPIDVSSKILSKMKADAEAALGEPVTQAVITVPAYFNDSQRKATVEAGEKAGLKVLRIINEPTAAALAYGLNKAEGETILVYDLGGGTFDVTILEISGDGLFTVKSTAGDTHLGGDDFDEVLIEFILDNYLGDFFVMRPDFVYTMEAREQPILSLDTAQMTRLRDAAEQLKKELSAGKSAAFNIPYFHFEAGKPVHLKGTITRDEFDSAIYPIVERTRVCVKQAMDDAGLKPKDINKVVFVGGSTRVPLISEKVTEWTFQKPNRSVNPDEAVALGAAVQAAVLAKEIEPSVIVLDVTPLSLGIQTMGGVMTRMIGRNTTVPVAFTENFSTAEDGQDAVDIRVYQGERPQAKDNHFLGEFHLEGIPPAPRGTPKIDVTFAVDANGILSVTAVDRATGQEKTVTMTSSSSLSDDEVARRLADAQAHAKEDEALLVKFEAQDTLRSQLIQLEALLRDGAAAIPEDKLAELGELRASLETALADGSPVPVLDSLSSLAEDAIKENSKLVYKAAAQFVGGETVTAETIETE